MHGQNESHCLPFSQQKQLYYMRLGLYVGFCQYRSSVLILLDRVSNVFHNISSWTCTHNGVHCQQYVGQQICKHVCGRWFIDTGGKKSMKKEKKLGFISHDCMSVLHNYYNLPHRPNYLLHMSAPHGQCDIGQSLKKKKKVLKQTSGTDYHLKDAPYTGQMI